jgi:hypothetical protein
VSSWSVLAERAERWAIADSASPDPAGWPTCGYGQGELDPNTSHGWEMLAHRAVTAARRNGVEPDPTRWGHLLEAHDRVAARIAANTYTGS